jgi:hypothetical protein
MPRDLLTPILDDDLRNVHYFNGRILYAEDLVREQATQRRQREFLGRLTGEGVAYGLQVSLAAGGSPPRTVTIEPGLALNREGALLHLSEKVQLDIAPEIAPPPAEDSLFRKCGIETAIPDGLGPYVLVVSPAAQFMGRTPSVGIGDRGVSRQCGRRFVVDGVQFRLLHLDVEDGLPVPESMQPQLRELILKPDPTEAEAARLRNLLAHWCLGTASAPNAFARDLYPMLARGDTEVVGYGPLDALRSPAPGAETGRLDDCDVPLALLYWTGAGIRFVDMWAVRRRLHRATAPDAPPAPGLARRRAENEAAFLQFQGQIDSLVGPTAATLPLERVDAVNYFRYLPAAGVLPVLRRPPGAPDDLRFFVGRTRREPVFIEGPRLAWLLDQSFAFPPFDTSELELIWLYRVRENRHDPGAAAVPYLVFTSGHVPFVGDPLYDVGRWDYGNYGPGVFNSIAFGG